MDSRDYFSGLNTEGLIYIKCWGLKLFVDMFIKYGSYYVRD